MVAYSSIVLVFAELRYFLTFEHRVLVIALLFFMTNSIKLTFISDLNYLYILTNDNASTRQDSIRNAAIGNALVFIALLLLNIFLVWRCAKCSHKRKFIQSSI